MMVKNIFPTFLKQWKYYNSSIYNLRVRKQVGPNRYVKIGLQLYQVDQKSFLLDFRFFDQSQGNLSSFLLTTWVIEPKNGWFFKEEIKEIEAEQQRSLDKDIRHHHVMEFFELCADLIGSLAR